MALGDGSLFNHNAKPSVDYRIDTEACCIKYYSSKTIEKGQELCIYYGSNLWFDDVNAKAREESSSEKDFL